MLLAGLIAAAACAQGARARRLWATEPADPANIIMTAYPLGNGKLGGEYRQRFKQLPLKKTAANNALAMPLGIVGEDIVVLNEHSLWSGGPFQSPVSI